MLIDAKSHFPQSIADLRGDGQLADANDRAGGHPAEGTNGFPGSALALWDFAGGRQILFIHCGQRRMHLWLTQGGTARELFWVGENYFAAAWRVGCAGIVATRYCTSELI